VHLFCNAPAWQSHALKDLDRLSLKQLPDNSKLTRDPGKPRRTGV